MSKLFIRLQTIEAEEPSPESLLDGNVLDDHTIEIGDADNRKVQMETGKLFEAAKRLIEG